MNAKASVHWRHFLWALARDVVNLHETPAGYAMWARSDERRLEEVL